MNIQKICPNIARKPNGLLKSLRAGLEVTLILLISLSLFQSRPENLASAATSITFVGSELVGNPTDTSIVINIIPNEAIEYHYQYGTESGNYSLQTANFTAVGGKPDEITISDLTPNTRYYYRMRYHAPGQAMDDWVIRDEHSFMTQRASGESFVFTLTADSHNAAASNTNFVNAMQNIMQDHPDFHIDIGDTQFAEFTRNASIQDNVDTAYKEYRATTHFGAFGHSAPIFLATGNHEEEEGWNLDDSYSRGIANIQARKAFFPTPIEDGVFYTGNIDPLPAIDESVYGDEFREDYYAWEWGDVLFVVIDPFQYTMNLAYSPGTAGEENDDPMDGDQWSWTLGAQQFQWLREILENSDAKYKFMFSHNMLGGINRPVVNVEPGYVRGGAEAARYYEWGGKNANEQDVFSTFRDPELFGTKPIHQLMVENGVSAYFHGHDHQYAYELRDDIVYQEVPSPSMTGTGFGGIYEEGTYEDFQTIKILPSPGHLRFSVTPSQTTVEYVRSDGSNNGTISYTYIILPNGEPGQILGDVNGDNLANSTDALIVLSGDVGIDISGFCPINCGDVNGDGVVNSTDALAILSYDIGMTTPFLIGTGSCPSVITQPAGCTP